ncbi:hypothetical protein V6Z11_D02G040500 [Gossypium hirsutum]
MCFSRLCLPNKAGTFLLNVFLICWPRVWAKICISTLGAVS